TASAAVSGAFLSSEVQASTSTPVDTDPTISAFIDFLLSMVLEILLFHFVDEMFAGAHRERQDRPRDVLVGLRDEWTAVHAKQVLTFMRLVPLVQRRRLRIVAHPDGTCLMDNIAGCMQTIIVVLIVIMSPGLYRTHLMQDIRKGLLHVFRL